jgi:male germ cell-associated kinase
LLVRARLAKEIDARPPFTDYVSTRWYRAPEILLRAPDYNAPIDIFAMGCIMAELFTMRPLFPGQSEQDQMTQICKVLGTPKPTSWPNGFKLAKQLGYTFPTFLPQSFNMIM